MEELTGASSGLDLRPLLAPSSIAVVGASDKSYFSQKIVENLTRSREVKVHLVNPGRDSVHGITTYPSLEAIPGDLDQVVVLVPQRHVGSVLDEAHHQGARSAVVIASEPLEEGSAPGKQSRQGLLVLGSGSLGYIGASARVNAIGSHFLRPPLPGKVAVISQSGGLAVTAVRLLDDLGTGVSFVVTVGAERELDATHFLEHAISDPETEAVLLLIEGVRRPGAFVDALAAARQRGIPVVIHKLGWSERGSQMAVTHTGSLAGSAEAFEAICRRHDAAVAWDLDEAVDLVSVLQRLRGRAVPRGDGVVVVTASGAAGIAAADAAERRGVSLPPLSEATTGALKELLPDFAHASNPLDVTAQVRSDRELFDRATAILGREPGIGAILFAFALGLPDRTSPSHQASFDQVAEVSRNQEQPVIAASIARTPITEWGREFLIESSLPYARSFDSAFTAITAWSRLTRPGGGVADSDPVTEVDLGEGVLDEVASKRVLAAYGVATPHEAVVISFEEAREAARSIGYPVSVKIVNASLPHKADAGGVVLGVADDDALRDAVAAITNLAGSLGETTPAILISSMVRPVHEVLVGAYNDPQFGPMVVCGHGGSKVEAYALRPAVAPAPLPIEDAFELIDRSGVGKAAADADLAALAEVLVAVSRLMAEHKDRIVGIDVNPVAILAKGAVALDALIETRG